MSYINIYLDETSKTALIVKGPVCFDKNRQCWLNSNIDRLSWKCSRRSSCHNLSFDAICFKAFDVLVRLSNWLKNVKYFVYMNVKEFFLNFLVPFFTRMQESACQIELTSRLLNVSSHTSNCLVNRNMQL